MRGSLSNTYSTDPPNLGIRIRDAPTPCLLLSITAVTSRTTTSGSRQPTRDVRGRLPAHGPRPSKGDDMTLRVRGIPSEEFDRLRRGGPDANGQAPLVHVAEGLANPCRHCIGLIAEGDAKLVLAYRP